MLSLRPLAATALRTSRSAILRPSVLPASRLIFAQYRRNVATKSTTPEEALEILKRQRAKRPDSPHLTIYKPQLTMVLSGLHRITGVALGLSLYAFLLGYIGLPLVGYNFSSEELVGAFGALPLIVKIPFKFLASIPFTFHSFNGLRHLLWDTARELTLKGVYRTGWTVVGLTFVSSAILAFI